MAYCTHTQVRQILVKVTVSAMSTVNVEAHITRADSVIDAKLSSLFTVPFSTTPPLITTISTYLSAYMVAKASWTRDSANKSDWVQSLKDDANDWLEGLIKGRVQLVDSSGVAISKKVSNYYSTRQDYTPVFDMDNVLDWEVDGDLIDDIADDRD